MSCYNYYPPYNRLMHILQCSKMEAKEQTPKRFRSPRLYLRNRMERFESKVKEISKNLTLLCDRQPLKNLQEKRLLSPRFQTQQAQQPRNSHRFNNKPVCSCKYSYDQIIKQNEMYNSYFNMFESQYAKTKEEMMQILRENQYLKSKIGDRDANSSTQGTKRKTATSENDLSKPILGNINVKVNFVQGVKVNKQRQRESQKYEVSNIFKNSQTRSQYL